MAKNAVNYTGLIPEVGDSFESATTNTTGNFEGIDTKLGELNINKADLINGKIPIDQIPLSTPSSNGLMSAFDKKKLDKKPYTFNTVAEMQDFTTLVEGDIIQLLGYYENDGAGHYRKIESSDDGSGITVGSLWANYVYNSFAESNHFGLIKDSSVDVSSKLNSIISMYETVFINKGKYRCDNDVYLYPKCKFLNSDGAEIVFYGNAKLRTASPTTYNLTIDNSILDFMQNEINYSGDLNLVDYVLKFKNALPHIIATANGANSDTIDYPSFVENRSNFLTQYEEMIPVLYKKKLNTYVLECLTSVNYPTGRVITAFKKSELSSCKIRNIKFKNNSYDFTSNEKQNLVYLFYGYNIEFIECEFEGESVRSYLYNYNIKYTRCKFNVRRILNEYYNNKFSIVDSDIKCYQYGDGALNIYRHCSKNKILGNTIENNLKGNGIGNAGFILHTECFDNIVKNNVVSSPIGFYIYAGADGTIEGNVFNCQIPFELNFANNIIIENNKFNVLPTTECDNYKFAGGQIEGGINSINIKNNDFLYFGNYLKIDNTKPTSISLNSLINLDFRGKMFNYTGFKKYTGNILNIEKNTFINYKIKQTTPYFTVNNLSNTTNDVLSSTSLNDKITAIQQINMSCDSLSVKENTFKNFNVCCIFSVQNESYESKIKDFNYEKNKIISSDVGFLNVSYDRNIHFGWTKLYSKNIFNTVKNAYMILLDGGVSIDDIFNNCDNILSICQLKDRLYSFVFNEYPLIKNDNKSSSKFYNKNSITFDSETNTGNILQYSQWFVNLKVAIAYEYISSFQNNLTTEFRQTNFSYVDTEGRTKKRTITETSN